MQSEVLTNEQRELLPLIKSFSKDYYLVGGTAIALHIGHRRSIDFDLFTTLDIKRKYPAMGGIRDLMKTKDNGWIMLRIGTPAAMDRLRDHLTFSFGM